MGGVNLLATMKEKVCLITRRTVGRSIPKDVAELRSYLLEWKEYFRLADTLGVLDELGLPRLAA